MRGGDEMLLIVQPVDADMLLNVDFEAMDIALGGMLDVVTLTDDAQIGLLFFVNVVDSVTLTDADYIAENLVRNLADAVVMTDVYSRAFSTSKTLGADSVAMTDSLSIARPGNLSFSEALHVTDAGSILHYDYAAIDYFATPIDYVSESRVF